MVEMKVIEAFGLLVFGFIAGGVIGVMLGTIRASLHYCDIIDDLRQKLMEVYK